MSMRTRSARLLALAVLVIAAAACTKTLDTDGLEGELRSQAEERFNITLTSVDCPADIEVEAGGTFTCDAKQGSGATFTLQVTQSDDQGNVEWDLVDAAPKPGA